MKKAWLTLALVLMGSWAYAVSPFVEANGGLIKESYGIRVGAQWHFAEVSFGYLKDTDHDVDFHTVGGNAYGILPIKRVKIKLGGGVGYTMPNLPDGISVTADNNYSLNAGAGLEYSINSHWGIAGSAHRFFFTTDTHTTVYSSHEETTSTGNSVEVLDVSHFDNSQKYDNIQAHVELRYYF